MKNSKVKNIHFPNTIKKHLLNVVSELIISTVMMYYRSGNFITVSIITQCALILAKGKLHQPTIIVLIDKEVVMRSDAHPLPGQKRGSYPNQ